MGRSGRQRSLDEQATTRGKPDPFTPEARDAILEYYRVARPAWFPLVSWAIAKHELEKRARNTSARRLR